MSEFYGLAFVLCIAILTVIFLVLFSVRFYQTRKAFKEHRETILGFFRSGSSKDEFSAYLDSLSYDELKFICDWYGFDINHFRKGE